MLSSSVVAPLSRHSDCIFVDPRSNAQRNGMVMWDEVIKGVATEFPDVTLDHMLGEISDLSQTPNLFRILTRRTRRAVHIISGRDDSSNGSETSLARHHRRDKFTCRHPLRSCGRSSR